MGFIYNFSQNLLTFLPNYDTILSIEGKEMNTKIKTLSLYQFTKRIPDEQAARNNNRNCDTVDILAITARNTTGKLLPYKELVHVCS